MQSDFMIERVKKILQQPVCDHCLGRQFSQLLSGYSNDERGRMLRTLIAMKLDSGEKLECDPNNFFGYKFRLNKEIKSKKQKCSVCNNFFEKIDRFVERIEKQLKKYEFKSFLIGTKVSSELLNREEELWERIGIDFCEPIKAEINREIGKRLEKRLKKRADFGNPDITILLDLQNNRIKLQINPLYIFGYYQKLVRGIPQCKWVHYRTSVEQIIGKPILKLTNGKSHKFHGAGREDVSARCLAWRAFVIEIESPKRRNVDLREIQKMINRSKKVKVKGLRISDLETVRKIKQARPDKTYRIVVKIGKALEKKDLKVLKKLIGTIKQRTPQRVLHRRGDLLRKREVKALTVKQINSRTLELKIKASAGLYIKELVSGDEGRTKPSVAELLGCKATCKELDVIGIEKI